MWAFLGDGETDEPESLGAISLAGREKLDNLIFVVNCNLQRLDGPVRGNGKIIQELEGVFRGAGWNVIKVVWGSGWDPLLAADKSGLLLKRMEECVDGEYQDFKSKNGAYVREHFFGKYPELLDLVKDMTDDQIWALSRGGHDPSKVYAAYKAAVDNVGSPTVILAKTVKGYGMGEAGEGQNITHQQKKMGENVLRAFRDRFGIDLPDEKIAEVPFLRLPEGSREQAYLRERREALGGALPARRPTSDPLPVPELSAFAAQLKPTGDREISTTMAFVRILTTLLRDKQIGKRVVPIVPDESRTFGMEGLFRQFGIFSQVGQLYRPEDANQLMYYKEDKSGQMLQEGINEAGAMSSWIAAATSYSVSDTPMIPFYIYYSMFGFQRIGDLAWAAGRLPGARVPDRRHRRADHAQRRGPAARGRPQPPDLGDHPELRVLRPDLRPRGGGDRAGRAAADVRRAGGRLLLPHDHERELHPPRHARGPGARRWPRASRRGMYLLREGLATGSGAQARPPRAAAGQRHDPARGRGGRRRCWSRTSASPRTCGVPPASPSWPATASTPTAGTCCIPGRSRGRLGDAAAGRAPGRSGRRGDGLHAGLRRADPAPGDRAPVPGAGHRRFRPLGLPRRPAPAFRGRPPPRRSRRVDRARRRGRRSVDDRHRRHHPLRHRRRQAQPGPGLKKGTSDHDWYDDRYRGHGSRHRRLRRRPDHRGARRGR